VTHTTYPLFSGKAVQSSAVMRASGRHQSCQGNTRAPGQGRIRVLVRKRAASIRGSTTSRGPVGGCLAGRSEGPLLRGTEPQGQAPLRSCSPRGPLEHGQGRPGAHGSRGKGRPEGNGGSVAIPGERWQSRGWPAGVPRLLLSPQSHRGHLTPAPQAETQAPTGILSLRAPGNRRAAGALLAASPGSKRGPGPG